ncbi:MAG: cation transporter [Bacteroidales bacterium]|nr:cation transporter [Bacteroidales bacterium]
MSPGRRAKAIKTASWVAISGNALLALAKISTGIFANSLSVIADGIDSTGDVIISAITLYIASIISRPPSLKFPYGYAKAETNATNALSFIILFAGAQLAITSAKRLLSGEIHEIPGKAAMVVLCVSIAGKFLLAWQQYKAGKKTNSKMLLANAKNMQGDVLISSAVLLGLVFTHLFHLPVLDPIAALLVSLWVIWVAIRIFLETNVDLMDGNVNKDVYKHVYTIVESVSGVYDAHRLRIRKIGPQKMINIDIEVNGKISLAEAHNIAHEVESKLKCTLDDVFDVAIHMEPYGEHLDEKELGVSKKELL